MQTEDLSDPPAPETLSCCLCEWPRGEGVTGSRGGWLIGKRWICFLCWLRINREYEEGLQDG